MKTYRQYLNEADFHTPKGALDYAKHLGRRDPEAEKMILNSKDSVSAYRYAVQVMHGRWPEAEEFIAHDYKHAYEYAHYVLQGRFPKAEPYIEKDSYYWWHYVNDLKKAEKEGRISVDKKMRWLKEEGVTDILFEILNFLGMEPEVQEYVIKKRPDLISQIMDLDPEFEAKYSHETDLSKTDL